MAGTFTADYNEPYGVAGNVRIMTGVLDGADGATEAIPTGLKYVAGFSLVPKSCATNGGVTFSKDAGTITPTTCDSGDTWYAIILGR